MSIMQYIDLIELMIIDYLNHLLWCLAAFGIRQWQEATSY